MDEIRIEPKKLGGNIEVPASKSICHRAIICAALSKGESILENILFSDDILVTIDAMRSLGAKIKIAGSTVKVNGIEKFSEDKIHIECNESGSTLRFLIPIALLGSKEINFTGKGRLGHRPLTPYFDIFEKQNIKYEVRGEKTLPLKIEGGLKADRFIMPGDVSSQFISGLLFALPLLEGDSEIVLSTKLESKGYVDLTLESLKKHGIQVENNNYESFYIRGNQQYKPCNYSVEGDYSQAAFWIAAGLLGSDIVLNNLNKDSLQGDKAIIDIAKAMGGNISWCGEKLVVKPSQLKATVVDVGDCPDILPILTVMAAVSEGKTFLVNAARLRIKESDRLSAIATELNKIGGRVQEQQAGLIIEGVKNFDGARVSSWKDHRIAMSLAIASIKANTEMFIENSSCVRKSYPHFYEDFNKLGGESHEWNLGQ